MKKTLARIVRSKPMEFLDECFCGGQLDELIAFLKMMDVFCFMVLSTGSSGTYSLSSNTMKQLGDEIRNNSVVCPIHKCHINVDHLRDEYTINKERKTRSGNK